MTNYFLFESNEAKNIQNQNILTKQKLFVILNINYVMYSKRYIFKVSQYGLILRGFR